MENNGDYDVGYGKPPKHTRFKPGRSGNPKGRPRKNPSIDDILSVRLAKLVSVEEGGVAKKITVMELLLRKLIKNAADGDFRSLKLIMDSYVADDAHDSKPGQGSQERDRHVLSEFARMRGVSLDVLIDTAGDTDDELE